jgi:hypothetical protein
MAESAEWKEVFYTGLDGENEDNLTGVRCYFCKREAGSESLIVVDREPASKELELKSVTFSNPQNRYRYLICDECLMLLGAFSGVGEMEVMIEG